MSTTRVKWHPPPPPTPRILHFPRRSRLFRPAKPRAKLPAAGKPNLEALMRQESRGFRGEETRPKLEESYSPSSCDIARDLAEEKWKFEADVLRAECAFLRMDREVALRKLERNRVQMESALTYFMETMFSGREKIDGRSGNAPMALNEEIEEILTKLEEIHGGFKRGKAKIGRSGGNFDRRVSILRRRLENIEEESSVKEIREVPKQIAGLASDPMSQFSDVEKLRMKMEGLSKGMIERMEEHGLLSTPAAAGGGSERRLPLRRDYSAVTAVLLDMDGEVEPWEGMQLQQGAIVIGSCCNCKNLVDKIAEQLMAEAEQCGEMQEMLGKVKADMDELRSSRDHWEHRALSSELKFRSLHSQMMEWKRRALESEKADMDVRKAEASSSLPTLSDLLESEICRLKRLKIRGKEKKSSELQDVKEKHVVVCQRRSPMREIGNLHPKGSNARVFR